MVIEVFIFSYSCFAKYLNSLSFKTDVKYFKNSLLDDFMSINMSILMKYLN